MKLKKTAIFYLLFSSSVPFLCKRRFGRKDRRRIRKSPALRANREFNLSRQMRFNLKKRGNVSLSHKDGACLLGFSKKSCFGVDLEKIKNRNFDAVIEFCFNEDERELLGKTTQPNMLFYALYTAKEALVKANKLGFSDLAKVGYSAKKMAFVNHKDEVHKALFGKIKDDFIFCLCFKDKEGIIFFNTKIGEIGIEEFLQNNASHSVCHSIFGL